MPRISFFLLFLGALVALASACTKMSLPVPLPNLAQCLGDLIANKRRKIYTATPTFCKCTCFKNSTVVPLDDKAKYPDSSEATLHRRGVVSPPGIVPFPPLPPLSNNTRYAPPNGNNPHGNFGPCSDLPFPHDDITCYGFPNGNNPDAGSPARKEPNAPPTHGRPTIVEQDPPLQTPAVTLQEPYVKPVLVYPQPKPPQQQPQLLKQQQQQQQQEQEQKQRLPKKEPKKQSPKWTRKRPKKQPRQQPEEEPHEEPRRNAVRAPPADCMRCTKAFCLAQELAICTDATEEDVQTSCFQRDSRKDRIIVWGFIVITGGLLIWAAVRRFLERRESSRMGVFGSLRGYVPLRRGEQV
ncbi:hypothetical protein ACRALDRAFT_1079119 [Sodiomyces alcalophilus JCM 7366]|uniref:uncharacterized protein n=1 Tax=Sodiomyces alcalophilus JCM 7366 TaxID=591952 RepID=UPI0039B4FF9C